MLWPCLPCRPCLQRPEGGELDSGSIAHPQDLGAVELCCNMCCPQPGPAVDRVHNLCCNRGRRVSTVLRHRQIDAPPLPPPCRRCRRPATAAHRHVVESLAKRAKKRAETSRFAEQVASKSSKSRANKDRTQYATQFS